MSSEHGITPPILKVSRMGLSQLLPTLLTTLTTSFLTSILWGVGLLGVPLIRESNPYTSLNAYGQKVTEPIDSIPITKANPSLWWIKERLEQNDQPWIEKIMIGEKKVRIVVLSNLWIKANYLDRFSFLYKVGQEAQMLPQTYIVELTDRRNNILGTYSIVNRKWNIASEQMENNPFRVTMPSIFNNPQ